MIAHRDRSLVMRQFSPNEAARTNKAYSSMAEAFNTMISDKKGIADYSDAGTDFLCGFEPVRDPDWLLAVAMDKRELMAGIYFLSGVVILGTFLLPGLGDRRRRDHRQVGVRPPDQDASRARDHLERGPYGSIDDRFQRRAGAGGP